MLKRLFFRLWDWIARRSPEYRRQAIALGKFEVDDAARRGITLGPGWYQFCTERGECRGFSFICTCRTEIIYLGFDWLKERTCTTCGKRHNLIRDLGLGETRQSTPDWQVRLSKLPVRYRRKISRKGQPWLAARGVYLLD